MAKSNKLDTDAFGHSLAISHLEDTELSFIVITAKEDKIRFEFRTEDKEEIGELLAAAQLEYDKLCEAEEQA